MNIKVVLMYNNITVHLDIQMETEIGEPYFFSNLDSIHIIPKTFDLQSFERALFLPSI